jgi:hypothetical protein
METKCLNCKQLFNSRRSKQKFCSKKCRETFAKECKICGTFFQVHPSTIDRRHYCSKKCQSVGYKESMVGENNPNFGKKWAQEKRKEQSVLIKSKVDDEYRYKAGSANRGKKFSPERIQKMHGHRNSDSYGYNASEETKKKIGAKSKEKFTEEFNIRHRKTMEGLGYWVPLAKKTDYEIYFKEADWIGQYV